MNTPNKEGQHHSKMRAQTIIKHLINDILNGATYNVLYNKLIEDGYDIGYEYSNSSAQRLIRQARNKIKEDYAEALPQMRETLTAICLDILTDAKESGDRGNAIKAVQEVAKLTGAYEPTKVEAKVETITIDFNLTNESED